MRELGRRASRYTFKHLKRATKIVLGVTFVIIVISLLSTLSIATLARMIETLPLWAGVALLIKWNSNYISERTGVSEEFITYYSRWLLAICVTILSVLNSALILIYSTGAASITTNQFNLVVITQIVVYTVGLIIIYYITDKLQDEWPTEGTYMYKIEESFSKIFDD